MNPTTWETKVLLGVRIQVLCHGQEEAPHDLNSDAHMEHIVEVIQRSTQHNIFIMTYE